MTENCCPSTLPPVIISNYTPKGAYGEVGGLKTYIITGSATSPHGVIFLYDVFGFAPQILQGVDRLAESLNAVILVPDFLKGRYAHGAWFSKAAMEEGSAEKAAHEEFRTYVKFDHYITPLLSAAPAAKEKFPEVNSWGAFGLCWGGKIVALASAANTPFKASGQAHPGRPTKEDATAITIPHICLAAPEDNKDGAIDAYRVIFSPPSSQRIDGHHVPGEVETYETMFHGWMGGRANLEDVQNAKEFERGYTQIAAFFARYL